MIKVERKDKPGILAVNEENWTKEYLKARADYAMDKTPELKRIVEAKEKKYNHQEVKESLKSMFKGKCAFCESHITHVDYGQIEHFKPKSDYPELCFEWNNFLLSCSICNGAGGKGNKFPLESEGGPFVNPVDENPDDFFKFEYDDILKKFLVFPKNVRAATVLNIIKLNREDLAEHRTKQLSKIIFVIEKIIEKDKDKLEIFFNEFSEANEYYAFIKSIINKVSINT